MTQESFEYLVGNLSAYKNNLKSSNFFKSNYYYSADEKAGYCSYLLAHIIKDEAKTSWSHYPKTTNAIVILEKKDGTLQFYNPEALFEYFLSKSEPELFFMKYCSRFNLLWLMEEFCDSDFEVSYNNQDGENYE